MCRFGAGNWRNRRNLKLQSAMEYLMTYGWAILIIAIVMVALFELGIFNSANFAPKATAGACQVVRNVESVTLQGQCQGELPMYVAQLNGQSSYAVQNTGFASMNSNSQKFTISIWINPASTSGDIVDEVETLPASSSSWHDTWIELVSGSVYIRMWALACVNIGTVPTNQWSNIVMTYDGSAYKGYINGAFGNSGTGVRTVPGGAYSMFYALGIPDSTNCGSGARYKGMIANYQFYNTSLSANEIKQLYSQGLGGAPIDPLNVIGWWPLNGNTQDYSGNSNNAQQSAVAYTSAWMSGYVQP